MGYKICKDNEAKFMNLQSLMGIRDRIKNGDFPKWLLVEVLIRLSPKLVCRFKLVSKQWFSISSDPSFVRVYVSRASLLSQPWMFISHFMHRKGSQILQFPEYMRLHDVYSQVVKPSYCVLPLPSTQQQSNGGKKHYEIFAVSNGIVLYSLPTSAWALMHSYYICNPITGQWIALPTSTCRFRMKSCGFLTHVEDGLLKSYTVVLLEITIGTNILNFEVFFSETGEWKNFIVSNDRKISLVLDREATPVNGVLYWIAKRVGIIAYDPYQSPEHVRIIAFPADKNAYHSVCGEYQGKLRYFDASSVSISGKEFPNFKLWVLNDHISGGWSLQHKISFTDIKYDARFSFNKSILAPISFHPFDLDVVYLGCDDVLVSYNIGTRKIEIQQTCGRKNQHPPWWLAFLLVIPPWPISIPRSSLRAGKD